MKLTALAAVAVLALAGCSTGTGSAPLPQAPPASDTAPVATEVPPVTEAPAPAPVASTCDVVREALLTGTPAKVTASMKALIADKSAPATAREYARYYTIRDKGNKDLQTMDESLITMACS